jgi:phosphinothricin acetyltransferase
MIRIAKIEDAAGIVDIYNYYIENTNITFETKPIQETEMQNRIRTVLEKYPFLVYEESGRIRGYGYASDWKKREAYRHTVESTIYMDRAYQGKGTGATLMDVLLKELKNMPVHAVIACIAIPNPQSIKFHEKFGFRQVSEFKEVGYKFGKWIDVGDWQRFL